MGMAKLHRRQKLKGAEQSAKAKAKAHRAKEISKKGFYGKFKAQEVEAKRDYKELKLKVAAYRKVFKIHGSPGKYKTAGEKRTKLAGRMRRAEAKSKEKKTKMARVEGVVKMVKVKEKEGKHAMERAI